MTRHSQTAGVLGAIALCVCTQVAQAASLLAFPEAEGFGRYTVGARAVSAPEVYHVTNLNDAGTGSLRDAVSKAGRIVVFDVSGIINLQSTLIFSGNSIIAGQTAPGGGIMLYGDRVSFSGASNLIVRYLRVHMGVGGASGKDAAGVANGSDMIFDHMSVTWGRDETFSISWDSKGTEPGNITIQNSIIGQGLQTHSCGGLLQTDGGVTIFRSLYIDNKTRNPKVKGLNQFVNNVVYNWGGGGGYIMGGSAGDSWTQIEENYFIKGPSTGGTAAFVRSTETFQVYQKNNVLDYDLDGTLDGSPADASIFSGATQVASTSAFSGSPKAHPAIASKTSAAEAYQRIVKDVGASFPARSEVDKAIVAELTSLGKKGALISNESALGLSGGVGTIAAGTRAKDTDNDGMPDTWEDANGLNKSDATDAVKKSASGYLNIELYINGLVTEATSPMLGMSSGSSEQTVILGDTILPLVFEFKNATGAVATGLPSGVTASVDAAKKLVTISGKPAAIGSSTFTVTTAGGTGDASSLKGTVHVVAKAAAANRGIVVLSSLNAAWPLDGVGVYEEKNTGWVDSGYWNFINSTSSYATWNIRSSAATGAILAIRYANGGAVSRNMALEFNGASLGAVAFPSTGAWTSWDSVAVALQIRDGLNTLTLTSMSADGGANVDQFQFDVAGLVLVRDTSSLDTLPDSDDSGDAVGIRRSPTMGNASGFAYDPASGVLVAPRAARLSIVLLSLDGRALWSEARSVPEGESSLAIAGDRIPQGIHRLVLRVDGRLVLSRKVAHLR